MIIGIGIDLVEIQRVTRLLEKHPDRFAKRLFTETEREYCEKMPHPGQHFAARFAAKEAFVKAIGIGFAKGIRWSAIGVKHLPSHQPILEIKGRALEELQARHGKSIHVTLSHTATHACAAVVIEGEPPAQE